QPRDVVRLAAAKLAGARRAEAEPVTQALIERWLEQSDASSEAKDTSTDAVGTAAVAVGSSTQPESAIAPERLSAPPRDRSATTEHTASTAHQATNGGHPATEDPVAWLVPRLKAAAPRVKRFGERKLFIGSAWEALKDEPRVAALGIDGFKDVLVEAHRRGVLELSRADLVAAMDPADVAASETRHLNATYHFIQLGTES